MWKPTEVLGFWYQHAASWTTPDRGFRQACRRRFVTLCVLAGEGGLDEWCAPVESAVALVLLLDALPRLIFADTAIAYEHSGKACALARRYVTSRELRRLPPWQQIWLMAPLVHSERRADQQLAQALVEEAAWPGAEDPALDGLRRAWQARLSEFVQFGRFPDRNALLGRRSTPEEALYLASIRGVLQV